MKDFGMESIGQRIKEMRTESGFTQKQLADAIGVAQNTISQYENDTALPGVDIIVKLADTLNTTTDYLLRGRE